MKKTISLLLSLLLLLTVLVGCGKSEKAADTAAVETEPQTSAAEEPAEEPAGIDTIVIGTTTSIETAVRGEYNYDMLASGVSEPPLVYQSTDGEYHPLLADFATEDSKSWTFTVCPGMCWEDGEPVTAEDILFTLRYEESQGSANFTAQTDSEGKVTQPKYEGYQLSEDRQSITLTLSEANVREPANMTSFRVMPGHIYGGRDTVTEAEARIGCGPYRFEAFSPESGTITFVKNEYYPDEAMAEKVIYRLFGNEDTMYMALTAGDIDMVWNYSAGVSATYADVLAADESLTVYNVPAVNAPAVLAFNNAKGIFTDENLRLAVSKALDYDAFKTCFGSPYAMTPTGGFVPPTTPGYTGTEELAQDLTAAAEYMAAAGYEKNADGYYVSENGSPAAFTLTYSTAKEAQAGYAELIKTQLEQFGIAVTLDGCDKDTYNAKTSNKFSENNITMEAAVFGYTGAGMGMGSGLATIYVVGTHPVQGGCQVYDERFSAALERLAAAGTMEEYCAAAVDIQQYYADHAPLLALYWDNLMYACSSRFDNVTVDCVFGLNNIPNFLHIIEK